MIAVLSLKCPDQRAALESILSRFIDAGIDINARNAAGLTVYDLAESESLRQTIQNYNGKTAKPEDIDHLFSWDIEASRREWPYQGSKRALMSPSN